MLDLGFSSDQLDNSKIGLSFKIDKEGRFVIKDQLQKFSKLSKYLIFIGKGNHFEIWDKQLGEKHKIVSRSKFK